MDDVNPFGMQSTSWSTWLVIVVIIFKNASCCMLCSGINLTQFNEVL